MPRMFRVMPEVLTSSKYSKNRGRGLRKELRKNLPDISIKNAKRPPRRIRIKTSNGW